MRKYYSNKLDKYLFAGDTVIMKWDNDEYKVSITNINNGQVTGNYEIIKTNTSNHVIGQIIEGHKIPISEFEGHIKNCESYISIKINKKPNIKQTRKFWY